jgi:hypothetical protein
LTPLGQVTRSRRQKGIALVLVVFFVALLTGLFVAYLSRAVTGKQLSTSSFSQTNVDTLARSATALIIGELKQEMINGSSVTMVGTPPYESRIYTPSSPLNMLPLRDAALTAREMDADKTNDIPNLIRTSTAPLATEVNSATQPSANGRFVSLARWNRHYLIPKDPTQDPNNTRSDETDPIAAFAQLVPRWIYITKEKGPLKLTTPSTGADGSAVTPIGRYAYAIYDEGGLFDVNALGYPSGTTLAQMGLKSSLAHADLASTFASLTPAVAFPQARIDDLVGWRHYASAQPGGVFKKFTFDAAAAKRYHDGFHALDTGFLKTGTASFNGRSDQAFLSRQQLIAFQKAVNLNGDDLIPVDERFPEAALQHLTHFSRELNQPSYSPDPERPKIFPLNEGGNDHVGTDAGEKPAHVNPAFLQARVTVPTVRGDGSKAQLGEALVKQRFALNRLAWLTYRGPSATRELSPDSTPFSWVPPGSATGLDYDIYLLLNHYGALKSQLELGNAASIYKYFGLSWIADDRNDINGTPLGHDQMKWVYHHEQPNPAPDATGSPITSLPAVGSGHPIKSLAEVAAAGREPDFVELLKASICAGSLGKVGTLPPHATATNVTPNQYQSMIDSSLDIQIIQIAANIIDQFDTDGMPTSILFDDNTFSQIQEYHGIEDVPYFLRVRGANMKVHDSNPPTIAGQPGYRNGEPWPENAPPLTDKGIGVFFQVPEIWNPHAWSTTSGNPLGPRPAALRLRAIAQPPSMAAPVNPDPSVIILQAGNRYKSTGTPPLNAAFQWAALNTYPQSPLSLTPENSELVFNVPTNRPDLFREPTLLNKPNVPTGSSLASGANHAIKSAPALSAYLVNGELQSKASDNIPKAAPYVNNRAPEDGTFLGVYLGAFPLRFANTLKTDNKRYVYTTRAADVKGTSQGLTYRMQYQDPSDSDKWITYDEKYCTIASAGGTSGTAQDTPYFDNNSMTGDGELRLFLDPRTSRFGGLTNSTGTPGGTVPLQQWEPGGADGGYGGTPQFTAAYQAGWAGPPVGFKQPSYQNASSQNATLTLRPDEASGFPFNIPFGNVTTAARWGWIFLDPPSGGNSTFRPGGLSQNLTTASHAKNRYYNDGGITNGADPNKQSPQFFSDPDGVVRRGMSAYTQPTATAAADPNFPSAHAGASSGLPLNLATDFSTSAQGTPVLERMRNRPVILNRPFRTVGELGYVFSGTPWRNLDFMTPESGNVALLDVFCINDVKNPNGLVAGKVNLNTRQTPVLLAILAGAYKDEFAFTSANAITSTGNASAQDIAEALVSRTRDTDATKVTSLGSGPLRNVSEVVGKFLHKLNENHKGRSYYDGGKCYSGFSGGVTTMTGATPLSTPPNLSSVLAADTSAIGYTTMNVQRYRESAIRALSNVGNTRTWNLMIDVVAQTGRYPVSASAAADLPRFNVEGEQRYWVHVAIDRYTGEVIDQQIEIVKE